MINGEALLELDVNNIRAFLPETTLGQCVVFMKRLKEYLQTATQVRDEVEIQQGKFSLAFQ